MKIHTWSLLALILILTVTQVTVAQVQPILDHDSAHRPSDDSVIIESLNNRITQIGVPIEPINSINGFGRNVTIPDGIRQIVPQDRWRVYISNTIDRDTTINWRGSPDLGWVGVLDNALRTSNLHALVNWNKREVIVDHVDDVLRRKVYKCIITDDIKKMQEPYSMLEFIASKNIAIVVSSSLENDLKSHGSYYGNTLGQYLDDVVSHNNAHWDIKDGVIRLYRVNDQVMRWVRQIKPEMTSLKICG